MVRIKVSEMDSAYYRGRRHREMPSPETSEAPIKHQLTTQVAVEVKFGVASKNCDNYGICHIDLTDQLLGDNKIKTPCCLRKTTAILSISDHGAIELAFPKSAMKTETADAFFSKAMFKVEGDFEFSNAFREHFHLKNTPKIIRGNYRIISTIGFYVINFF